MYKMILDLSDPEIRQRAREAFLRLDFNPGGRGFLSNHPPDVIHVFNGQPITKADILDTKRERQRLLLNRKRQVKRVVVPCFVWVFYKDPATDPFYWGWYLYVRTLKHQYPIGFRGQNLQFRLPIMRLFPCGHLPMIENFTPWMRAFAEIYHRPIRGRPSNNGLAVARAVVDPGGRLLEVLPL